MGGFGFGTRAMARRRRQAGANAGARRFAVDMPLIAQGDSITTLAGGSSWLFWANFLAFGRFAFTAGHWQAIAASEINEPAGASPRGNAKDVLRADRLGGFTHAIGPDAIASIAIGINSAGAPNTLAEMQAGYDELVAACRARLAPIILNKIMPAGSNAQWAMANPYIASLAAEDLIVVDGPAAWGESHAGNTDSSLMQPNCHGAVLYGQAFRDALAARGIAFGLTYGANPGFTALANPSDNIVTDWDFGAETAGGRTGSPQPSGTVPTGVTVSNAVAGIGVACSLVTENLPYLRADNTVVMLPTPVLAIDIAGTAAAQGTIAVTQACAMAVEQAGATLEHFVYMKLTHGDGAGAPLGVSGLDSVAGTVSKWSQYSTSPGSGLIDMAAEGVARGRTAPASATVDVFNLTQTIRVNAGTVNARLKLARPYVRRSERGAPLRSVRAVHTARADSDLTAGPLAGPGFTGTAANGNTLTGRPGAGWVGESRSFAYQWQRSSNGGATVEDIAGATGIAYAIAGQSGCQLRLKVTGSNALGSDSAVSAWSGMVA